MRLDLVIPAHNEEHRIGRTLDTYRAACGHTDVRFVVALDRCTDRTADVVAEHTRADDRVRVVEYPKLGKGGVIMETLRRCDGDLVGFVDADCATPPAEMLRLGEAAAHADGAIASRRHPASVVPGRRRPLRRLTAAGFAFGVRRLFRLPYTDTQCGAKVLRREVVHACLPFLSSRDFLFDVDLLVVARRLGFDVLEVPTVWIDRAGSHLDARRDSVRMAASSLRLWLHHRLLPVDAGAVDAGAADAGAVDAGAVADRAARPTPVPVSSRRPSGHEPSGQEVVERAHA
jgi:glycosyltransferase involved in cell wall biosynthesis